MFMPHHYAKLRKSKTDETTWSAEEVVRVYQAEVPSAPTQLKAAELQRSHQGGTNPLASS